MSIFGAMLSGVSGLSAQSQALSMISDNIANSNTTAYKGTEASFSTLVTQNGQTGVDQAGGVVSYPSTTISQQGLLQAASSGTDLAISGGGFFVVSNNAAAGSNNTYSFTRDGSFSIDANGDLVNGDGFFLQGQPLTAAQAAAIQAGNLNQLTATSLTSLSTINVNGLSGSAVPTSQVTLTANLPASDSATSAPHTITTTVYDTQGTQHTMTLSFSAAPVDDFKYTGGALTPGQTFNITINGQSLTAKIPATTTNPTMNDVAAAINSALTTANITTVTASANGNGIELTDSSGNAIPATDSLGASFGAGTITAATANTWHVTASVDGGTVAFTNGNEVAFNGDGSLASTGTTFTGLTVTWPGTTPPVGAPTTPQTITFNLGTPGQTNGLTQFGSSFTAKPLANGLHFGNFTDITIDQNGIVTANFDNGLKQPIYMIPLATFNNPDGLAAQSGNSYLQTNKSGSYLLQQANTGAAGQIAPSELESSNVDIASEFSNLIITQQAYAANSKVITTANQMLQTLMQSVQ